MSIFEIAFETDVPNSEYDSGYWYNYYTADTPGEAEDMFRADMDQCHITVRKIAYLTEIE